jgi:glycosyltransferase involved in cell wall biosynthesis
MKKIRVLHTEWSDGWGGQEIRIIGEMLALKEQGIEVFLACRNHSQIKQKAVKNNIKVFVLPFRGNADFKTLFAIKKIIKENKIDIVNTHSGKDTWVGGFAAKLAGIKFIRTRHLSNKINPARTNFINELADYIFTTGTSVAKDMVANNRINPDKILSIPTGIDDEVFNKKNYNREDCRKNFNFEDNQIVVGIIAVLRKFKRHDRFLQMAKFVIDNNPDKNIKFIIAGDGPQKDNIIKIIDDLELGDNVVMLGHIKNVAELLTALDIFVLTSDSGEGVPQSVMQSLLMQTKTIATNAGSTSDLLSDDNFLLVDKDSQNQLNDACNNLINNENLISNDRNYIKDNFSKKVMVKNILKIYNDLLK